MLAPTYPIQGIHVETLVPARLLPDLQPPGMRSDAVLAELRSDPCTAHLLVLLLSADATAQSWARLFALEANNYSPKPFSIEALLEKLDRLPRTEG